MPQAGRKDAVSQKAQENETKRARGALSCAECRRLKLKCDKTVPCSSCRRRGCSAICPNGSLITGQGTRFVLADTEKLHQKIAQMSDRIRDLEDALAALQSTVSSQPHPLLNRELLQIKSSLELHSAADGEEPAPNKDLSAEKEYIDAFGTLSLHQGGHATFFGRTAGSENILMHEAALAPEAEKKHSQEWQPDLPLPIMHSSRTFPLPGAIDFDSLVQSFLPPWEEAWRLCGLYVEIAPSFFGVISKEQIHDELLPMWYVEAPKPTPTAYTHRVAISAPGTGLPITKADVGGPHDLALLFILCCFGSLSDLSCPPAPENEVAEQYYQLSRTAVGLASLMDGPPSVAAVQTLTLMGVYRELCCNKHDIESTWTLLGFATKLAQSIGLHRDCARWQLSGADIQKRRALFWELFNHDCWISLATGRLPSFAAAYVDTEQPKDVDQTIDDATGTLVESLFFWKTRFSKNCLSAVAQGMQTSISPKYTLILELDRKTRDVALPSYSQGPPPHGAGIVQTMSYYMPADYRDITLLYIHRCHFANAVANHPMDPTLSPFAPSFLAGYRTACAIINSLKTQFGIFPDYMARFCILWSHAFNAALMLGSIVIHSSHSKVAPAALLELRSACDIFEKGAAYGGRAVRFIPFIRQVHDKAYKVFLNVRNGLVPSNEEIFAPNRKGKEKSEPAIFGNERHIVATMKPSMASSSSSRPSPMSPATPSDTSPDYFSEVPSFSGSHQSLVDQMNGFDAYLNNQIQNAYYVNHDTLAGELLGAHPQPYLQPPPLVQRPQSLYVPVLPPPHPSLRPSHSSSNIHITYSQYPHPQSQLPMQMHPQYPSSPDSSVYSHSTPGTASVSPPTQYSPQMPYKPSSSPYWPEPAGDAYAPPEQYPAAGPSDGHYRADGTVRVSPTPPAAWSPAAYQTASSQDFYMQ